ncbi:MAG: GHKL domain-containing protein [Erysipelotrichaceae bacterium]|uniref:GHKL domain-containing protein n=1 Tax=Anaerorhabdus sp. TaxID=1872524 RepID=UPI002FCBD539
MSLFDFAVNLLETSIILFLVTSLINKRFKNVLFPSIIYLVIGTFSISLINLYFGYESYLFIIDILLLSIYLKIISTDSLCKILAISTIPILFISNINPLVLISTSYIFLHQFDYLDLMLNYKYIVTFIAELLLLFFSILTIKYFKYIDDYISSAEYFLLFISFIVIKFIFISIEMILYLNFTNDYLIILTIYCLILLTILIFALFYRISTHRSSYLKGQFEIQLLNNQIRVSKELQKSQSELLRIRHDIKHILTLIDTTSISLPNQNLLSKFTDKYKKDINDLFAPFNTSEETLNNVLNIKYLEALENNIDIVSNVSIDEKISIDEDDLFILLSNLLDNAILHIGSEKKIRFALHSESNYLNISISNSIDNANFDINSIQKTEFHGYGIQTINTIIKKYKGEILFESDDSFFTVSILL